ncbi:TNN [Symbiodinium sp. CCMP2592]|nr:TNN [Symbiodinium sp. CCMP2592]
MDFIAWLCAGPSETKTKQNGRVHYASLKVNKRILSSWLTSDEDFASADMLAQHVLGAITCKAAFVYDASCVLTQVQNAQRLHWRDRGVPEGDLWYFKVVDCVFFAEPLPAGHFINHSKSKVYDIISEDSAAELALYVNPRPDWLDEGPRLCFKVPPRIAYLFLNQGWRDMCLPSPFIRGPWHLAAWKLDSMEHAFTRAFHGLQAAGARVVLPDGQRHFNLTDCRNLADDLRSYLGQVSEDSVPEIMQWIRQLQNTSDNLEVPLVATSQKFHRLIDFILLCDLLKDVGSAKEVINRALELTLPKSLLEIAKIHLEQQRFFDKGEISRFRIVLDVAFMLLQRVFSWVKFMKGERTSRFLMWDSSPQFSRDYEMIRIVSIPQARLWNVFAAVTRMSSMWLDTEAGDMAMVKLDAAKTLDEALQAEEAALMRTCEDVLRPHICPAVILGFGATSLSHKFHTLCHALRLEQLTGASLEGCSREFVSVTSDFGVEHMLGRVARVNVSELCPHFEDADDQAVQSLVKSVLTREDLSSEFILEEPDVRHAVPLGESVESDELEGPVIQPVLLADAGVEPSDLLEPLPVDPVSDPEEDVVGHDPGIPAAVFEEVPPSPCLDFTDMLSFPGLHHVLDNAINGIAGAMPNYKEFIHLASRLCKFLHSNETRDILLERCFGDPVGMQFREDFRQFKGHIFPGRWGTVAFSNWLCVSTLGLKSHPALANIRQKRNAFRDKVMAQVVYHADAMTLYTLPVPDLPMVPDDPGDPGVSGLDDAGDEDRDDEDDDGCGVGPVNNSEDDDAASDSAASQCAMDGHDDVGRIAAFDPKTASLKALVNSRAGDSEALLQKLMLQRLSEVLPEHGGQFLSIPFPEKAMRSLAAVLKLDNKLTFEPGNAKLRQSKVALDATLSPRHDFTADARSLLFFKVVRNNPMQLKRNKVPGEHGFASRDVIVAPHKLYDIDAGKKQVTVQAVALQKPASEARSMSTSSFVLSLQSLECQQLAELRTWEKRTSLKYIIKPNDLPSLSGWSKHQHEASGILLEELMESSDGVRGTFWRLASERKEILKIFADLDWVTQTAAGLWTLTSLGKQNIEVCCVLHEPRPILDLREGVEHAELSSWELIVALDRAGFEHTVKNKSKQDRDYDPADARSKVWYSKPNADTVVRPYLLCLLKGDVPVPHWKPAALYTALLNGEEYQPKKSVKMQHFAEDDMDAGSLVCPEKAVRRGTASKKKTSQREASPEVSREHGEEARELPSRSPAPADVDTSLMQRDQPAEGSDHDETTGSTSSSSSSSSSKSGSSDGSSSSSSSSSEEEHGDRAPAAARASNPNAGFRFGLNHVTQVFKDGAAIGFEMICHHPLHKQGAQKCRKKLNAVTRDRSEPETLRMLKAWGAWGAEVASRSEHQQVWDKVVEAWKDGTLPEEIPEFSKFKTNFKKRASKPKAKAEAKPKSGPERPAKRVRSS